MLRSQYFADSRSPRYAILFAAPLWLGYETLAWLLSSPGTEGVRNGADVLLKAPFVQLAGYRGVIGFEVLLLAGWARGLSRVTGADIRARCGQACSR